MLIKTASNSPRPQNTVNKSRNVYSATSVVSSPRRDGRNKLTERSKSSTPRSGRPKSYNGKAFY